MCRPLACILACILAALAVPLSGCVANRAQPEQAYVVNSQGAVAPTTRSALAGSTAPGAQEIVGIYLPLLGTGIAFKAGIEYDGQPTQIVVPIAPPFSASQAAPQCVDEQVTEYVPETRMVPRTRTVRRVLVPAPQAAPRSCPPPAEASAGSMCPNGVCAPPSTVATSGR